MRYEAVLLDADDTLLDFHRSERAAFNEVSRRFGLPDDPGRYERYHTINRDYWKRLERGEMERETLVVQRFADLFAAEGLSVDPVAFNRDYRVSLGSYAFTVPGAVELCRELSAVTALYMVTNGMAAVQERRLRDSGLRPFFREVFVSETMGAQKPQAAFFEPVLARVGVADRRRVLICGDSLSSDMRGGQMAGIDTCWFNPEGKTGGEACTYVISRLAELPPIVRGGD